MLIVNEKYTSLFNIMNESHDSDKFESKCIRYLRKQFPDHKFKLKGGNNNQRSDILVDDKFYIECKMTENGKKKDGSQTTGFGIKLIDNNRFTYIDESINNESANEILNYINNRVDDCKKFLQPHTGSLDFDLDPIIFARWINNYYLNKNVLFFITVYNKKLVLFKNTIENLLKYFNISCSLRYYKYGTKDLPISKKDIVINALKDKYKKISFNDQGNYLYVCINEDINSQYINIEDNFTIYLSNKNQKEHNYKIMKLSDKSAPRVIFKLHSKLDQDDKDFNEFKKILNKN